MSYLTQKQIKGNVSEMSKKALAQLKLSVCPIKRQPSHVLIRKQVQTLLYEQNQNDGKWSQSRCFLIINGSALRDTAEFMKLRRDFALVWSSISQLLLRLEDVLLRSKVHIAAIDGNKLHALATAPGDIAKGISDGKLLGCVVNKSALKLAALKQQLTQNRDIYGDEYNLPEKSDERKHYRNDVIAHSAAITLCRAVRRWISKLKQRRIIHGTAVRVQRVVRGWLTRCRYRKALEDSSCTSKVKYNLNSMRKMNAARLQKWWRYNQNSRVFAKRRVLLVLFINEWRTKSGSAWSPLTTLLRLRDPLIRMIVCTPGPPESSSSSALSRTQKEVEGFLSSAGISLKVLSDRRLLLVCPEASTVLSRPGSSHSAATQLWASARALRQMRDWVDTATQDGYCPVIECQGDEYSAGAGDAYSEHLSRAGTSLLRVSTLLDLPVLNSCVSLSGDAYERHELFSAAGCHVLPAASPAEARAVRDEATLLVTLSRLVSMYPMVDHWIARSGRGTETCVLKCGRLSVLQEVQQRYRRWREVCAETSTSGEWNTREVQIEVRKCVLACIYEEQRTALNMSCAFLTSLAPSLTCRHSTGGCVSIEGMPAHDYTIGPVEGSCFITPMGEVEYQGGWDVLSERGALRVDSDIGVSSPQSWCPSTALRQACEAVANELWLSSGYIGDVTVRFHVYWETDGKTTAPGKKCGQGLRMAAISMCLGLHPAHICLIAHNSGSIDSHRHKHAVTMAIIYNISTSNLRLHSDHIPDSDSPLPSSSSQLVVRRSTPALGEKFVVSSRARWGGPDLNLRVEQKSDVFMGGCTRILILPCYDGHFVRGSDVAKHSSCLCVFSCGGCDGDKHHNCSNVPALALAYQLLLKTAADEGVCGEVGGRCKRIASVLRDAVRDAELLFRLWK